MKHVLTPTPLSPRPIFDSAWLDAATANEPSLPKQERVPDPPEGYHAAAYGTLAFYEERRAWRDRHGAACAIDTYCCPLHAGDDNAVEDHLTELWGDGDWTARIGAAIGLDLRRWFNTNTACLAVNVIR